MFYQANRFENFTFYQANRFENSLYCCNEWCSGSENHWPWNRGHCIVESLVTVMTVLSLEVNILCSNICKFMYFPGSHIHVMFYVAHLS